LWWRSQRAGGCEGEGTKPVKRVVGGRREEKNQNRKAYSRNKKKEEEKDTKGWKPVAAGRSKVVVRTVRWRRFSLHSTLIAAV
jgi:hypothetical protein